MERTGTLELEKEFMLTTAAPGINSDKAELKPYVYEPKQIPLVWEELEPLIERSVEESHGMITTHRIHDMLIAGDATAFVTVREDKIEAVLILTLNHYATYRSALVIACAGKGLIEAWRFADAL